MERLRRIEVGGLLSRRDEIGRLLSRWGALGSLGVGVLFLLAGGALVAKHASSNDSSPFGWLFVVIGICGVLAAIGFVTGLYDEE